MLYRSRSHRNTNGRHTAARDDVREEQTRDGVSIDVVGILDKYLATRDEPKPRRVDSGRAGELAA